MRTIATSRFPRNASPACGHLVFTFVATQGNSHAWVVAIGYAPLTNIVRNAGVVASVKVICSVGGVRIRWIEKYPCDAGIFHSHRFAHDAGPIATTDSDISEPVGQFSEGGQDRLVSVAHPCVPKVRDLAVDAHPRVSKVRALAVDAHPRVSKVRELAVDAHPRVSKVRELARIHQFTVHHVPGAVPAAPS